MTTENNPPEITAEEAWEQYLAQHPPIKAHSYPMWIKIVAVIIIILSTYSLTLIPKYYGAARTFAHAKKEYSAENYAEAFNDMASVLNAGFYSKDTRVLMAKIMLKGFPEEEYENALDLLEGLSFKDREYKEIMDIMPARYFEEQKEDK